jgi:hypothetical protein
LVAFGQRGWAKVIAGRLVVNGGTTSGPILGLSTEPLFFDITLSAGARFEHDLPGGQRLPISL